MIQAELAERASIDVTYLSKIENDKVESIPKALWEKLWNILHAFDTEGKLL